MENPKQFILPASILLLAGAVALHAFGGRYQFGHMAGLVTYRADRLTGRVEYCEAEYRNSPPVCRAVQHPLTEAEFTAIGDSSAHP